MGNATDPVSSNDAGSTTTAVTAAADLAVALSGMPDPVIAGTDLTYTAVVTNLGPSDATGATVRMPVPAGTTFGSSPDGCTEAAGLVTCSVGSLVSGANRSVGFSIGVAADTAGPIAATATVSGNETDPVTANDASSTTTSVGRAADLEIGQTDTPDPVVAGSALTYTLAVTNVGPSDDLATVTVTDDLPAETSLVSAAGAGWTCGEAGGTVTCTRNGLPVGAAPPITVVVDVAPDTVADLTNTVSVASPTADPDPGPDDTNVLETTTVEREADLALIKRDSVDPVPGATFDYVFEVTNAGPSSATDVVVTDVLPAGLVFSSSADGCTEAGGSVNCGFGTLAPGATDTRTFTVAIDVTLAPRPTVTNEAVVAALEPDPDPADNTDTETTVLDLDPPGITLLDSVADTGDAELEPCEAANVPIERLLLTFDEAVRDPPGDTEVDDITNPANVLLVAAGADRTLQTTQCGGPAGDDVAVPVSTITFDAGTLVADLDVGAPLADDLYRLLVCADVADLPGNPLDGNGDGTGGDDFVRTFRVDATNRLANGHFDCDLSGWTPQSALPEEITWNDQDHQGSGDSGSVAVANLTAGRDFEISQCAELSDLGSTHVLGARLRLATAPGALLGFSRGCAFFDAPACGGQAVGTAVEVAVADDTGGFWLPLASVLTPPITARSARCSFLLSAPDGDAFDARLDALSLTSAAGLVFADGFESGDTTSWSSSIP